MIFGQSAEFSIEAYHEPSGPEYAGFGRISIEVQGVRLGDILENHCSLFHVVDRFRELIVSIAIQWDERFTGLSDLGIFKFHDQALYLGEESRWESYGKFNFLTNAGESFDGFKTFIVCRPDEQVQILCQSRNGVFCSMCCHMD